jgi:Rrf2 family transcriptional regulator, cysteine metabolism repressor
MFSTKSEYGVRVMVQLARRQGDGPVSLAEVASAENLPLAYLEQLVSRLRKAELVSSTRGAHGGYELTRDPAAITMADVVHALGERIVPMPCVGDFGDSRVLCNHEVDGYENCATKLLWTRVHGGIERALEQTTLAELASFAERAAPAPKPRSAGARPRARLRTTPSPRTQETRTVRNG